MRRECRDSSKGLGCGDKRQRKAARGSTGTETGFSNMDKIYGKNPVEKGRVTTGTVRQ